MAGLDALALIGPGLPVERASAPLPRAADVPIGSIQRGAEPDPGERIYLGTIDDLERLAATDPSVTPVTPTLTRALAIIDNAIAESRSAIAAAPSSAVARSHLRTGLRRKVALLQTVVATAGRPW